MIRRRACRLWIALFAVAWSGCAGPHRTQPRRSREPPGELRYHAKLSDDLASLDVTLCFKGPSARWLRPGKNAAAGRLLYARSTAPGPARRLHAAQGKLPLDLPDDGCVAYGVSLHVGGTSASRVWRTERALVASPSLWLWRPEHRAANVRAELTLELPDGVNACLPWAERAGRFQLAADAFRFDSYAAFGRFEPLRLAQGEVAIEAARLDTDVRPSRAALSRWLREAVNMTHTGGSVFPGNRLQIMLAAGAPGGEAFGALTRGGAASVLMLIPAGYGERELREDWVLVHELSHLQVPYVERDDAWLPEGLATYYQEVRRARAGVQSEQRALARLVKATRSARAQGTGRNLREESRDMHRTYAYRSVYWAGAAYFFIADVMLRERTQGQKTLDSVLAAQRGLSRQNRVFSGAELLARLDTFLEQPLFVPLATETLARPFPELAPWLERLGVRERGAAVTLDDAAPLSAIRRAIFHGKPQEAPTLRGSDLAREGVRD